MPVDSETRPKVFVCMDAYGGNWHEFITVFAFIAALCIGLLTAFNLNTKSNNMRTAWRRLNSAALMYNSGKINDEQLISEYKMAESIIGDVTYSGNS
jgi:hypothetical protein